MAVRLDLLHQHYFTFDIPVPYEINKQKDTVLIHPVMLQDSLLFFSVCDILFLPKDEINSVEIIEMSYLEYLVKEEFKEDMQKLKLFHILKLCLKLNEPKIFPDEKGRYFILDKETGIKLTARHFEDIRRIIMYQNVVGYDDSYIDPELKKSMEETKALKMAGIELPDLERKMAIISAHTGIIKKEQLQMTLREHEAMFQEICGEVEFMTTRPIALYGGKADEMGHWIFKKRKNKFDDYFTTVGDITSKLGTGMVQN